MKPDRLKQKLDQKAAQLNPYHTKYVGVDLAATTQGGFTIYGSNSTTSSSSNWYTNHWANQCPFHAYAIVRHREKRSLWIVGNDLESLIVFPFISSVRDTPRNWEDYEYVGDINEFARQLLEALNAKE